MCPWQPAVVVGHHRDIWDIRGFSQGRLSGGPIVPATGAVCLRPQVIPYFYAPSEALGGPVALLAGRGLSLAPDIQKAPTGRPGFLQWAERPAPLSPSSYFGEDTT